MANQETIGFEKLGRTWRLELRKRVRKISGLAGRASCPSALAVLP